MQIAPKTSAALCAVALATLAAACSRSGPQGNAPAPATPAAETGAPSDAPGPIDEAAVNNVAQLPPVAPAAPGTPNGLPDDRTPVSEAPFAETSAQGAANVLQTYYALIGEHRYREAWALWSDGGQASGMSADDFARSFARYADYHAEVGAPGAIEGAAGSLYVEVPVALYGRLASGEAFHMAGPVTLRRVNDVPGSTAAQRRWHIQTIDVHARPQG
jgi:hypothetical protein